MVAAGLLAKKAVERGLTEPAVGQDEPRAGLQGRHRLPRRGGADALPGAAAASTSSATAAPPASATAGRCPSRSPRRSRRGSWSSLSVLSGNRNFEGRIQSEVRGNYLMSPPLVVAYALAGRMDVDLLTEPLGHRPGREAGVPAGHLADGEGSRGDGRAGAQGRHVRQRVRRRLRGRRALEGAARARGRAVRLGRGVGLHPARAVLRRDAARSRARSPTSPARACWRSSATASRPTTSRPRARSARTARRDAT